MRNICNKKVAKVAKSSNLYFCELCDYKTSRKANYQKHLNTQKHRKKCNKSVTFCNKKVAKVAKKEYSCKFCEKSFSNRMGLWRHSKKCLGENLDDAVEHDISGEKVLVDKEEYIKLLEKAVNNKSITNIETQNNTQNISINVFLNEHCKDAMCLQDFLQQLSVSIKDISDTKQLGYVDGISNVIIKSLEDMPTTDRPIHSTDTKRNKFVVKRADGWKKDDGTEMDLAVTQVKLKHATALTEWENSHPGFENDKKLLEEWQSMLANMESGKTEREKQKNNKIIKKKIAEKISIKEAINNLKD